MVDRISANAALGPGRRPRRRCHLSLVVVASIDIATRKQSGLSCGRITPLFDYRLLYASGVLSGSYANFFGHVDAVLMRLEQRHELSHVFTFALWLQIAHFFGNFLNNRLLFILTLLRSGLDWTRGRSTQFEWDFFALSLGGVFLDGLTLQVALLHRPRRAALFRGVALGDLLALNLVLRNAVRHVVFDIVLVVSCSTLRLVLCRALDWSR